MKLKNESNWKKYKNLKRSIQVQQHTTQSNTMQHNTNATERQQDHNTTQHFIWNA